MRPSPFVVRRAGRELEDAVTLELEPERGAREFPFQPGQFTMVYAMGVGEVPLSISGDPERPERLVHTLRIVGAVTRAIGGSRRGTVLGVRGPFGRGWPWESAVGKDVVVVAGGMGLAPLRPLLYRILGARGRFGKVTLSYGARTPEGILFARELEKWRGRFDLDVRVTVDSAPSGWRGAVGPVTTVLPGEGIDPARTVAFACGPEVMMRFAVVELRNRGLGADQIFVSMERNMKCAVGFCGHCQFGPTFICKDGPVFPYSRIDALARVREL
jgi:NAD(P)H-flavin reductase